MSPATAAAHLSAPVVGPDVPPSSSETLVRTALAWVAHERHTRAVVEIAEHNVAGRSALERAGFREAFRTETLVLDL